MSDIAVCACGRRIEISEEAAARWRTFNAILRRRKDTPLGPDEVAVCEACAPLWRKEREAEGLKRWAEEQKKAAAATEATPEKGADI